MTPHPASSRASAHSGLAPGVGALADGAAAASAAATASAAPAGAAPSMDLTALLLFAKQAGASDLHLSARAPLMVRRHGEMRKLALPGSNEPAVFDVNETRTLIYEVLTDAQKKTLEATKELDFALTVGAGARFRGNVFIQQRGLTAVFRVVPNEIPSFDSLGLPPAIRDFARLEKGLVLVTGPTGSGKSTTLASLVDLINRERRGHILTIEDPIEFVHEPKSCMVNQREVGPHSESFANALRASLREDPDVILVGEMRDLETVALAVTAAETGHLVLGTLHTNSAAKTIDRIINVFPAGEQAQIRAMLADSLAGVVAQMLVPKVGGGRVAACEILVATSGVRAMIREAKTHQLLSAIQTGQRYGMQSLEQALMQLTMHGMVDAQSADRLLVAVGRAREEDVSTSLAGGERSARLSGQPGGQSVRLGAGAPGGHSIRVPAASAQPGAPGAGGSGGPGGPGGAANDASGGKSMRVPFVKGRGV